MGGGGRVGGGEGVTATSSTFSQPPHPPLTLSPHPGSVSVTTPHARYCQQSSSVGPFLSAERLIGGLTSWLARTGGITGERRHPSEFGITAFERPLSWEACATFVNRVGIRGNRWNSLRRRLEALAASANDNRSSLDEEENK